MANFKTTAIFMAFMISGCETVASNLDRLKDDQRLGLRSGSATAPNLGYIVYSGKSQIRHNLYRQDMDGMTPVGSPVLIYDDGIAGEGVVRYPQVTEDGRYIVFITRKSSAWGGDPIDELVIIDHQGNEWARPLSPEFCQNINYPEIVAYEYDASFSQTSMEVIAICADAWPPQKMLNFHLGPNTSYFDTDGQLEQMPVGEYAVLPGYSAAVGGYIFTSRGDNLWFTKYEHNQPGADKKDTGRVHIDPASRYDGGVCPLDVSIPCPVQTPPELQNVFAPSISPDGSFLMFNSEVYKDEVSRGQEFFLLDLPTTDIEQAYTPTWTDPMGYLSQINVMAHANNAKSSYGTFTVNGDYQYTIHGDEELRVAQDLLAPPVLIPSPNIKVWETGWFYKD